MNINFNFFFFLTVVVFYDSYINFLNTNNYDVLGITNRWVAKQMRINGYKKDVKNKTKVWIGIKMDG